MSLPSTLQSMLEDKYEELLAEGLTPEEAKDALLPNGQVPSDFAYLREKSSVNGPETKGRTNGHSTWSLSNSYRSLDVHLTSTH